MKSLVVLLAGLGVIASANFAVAQSWQASTVIIDSATSLPVGTGISAVATGDQFVIIAHGALQGPPLSPIDGGWFDPSGLIRLRRLGQIFGDMPYGSLFGHFNLLASEGFYLGDGGCFTAQPADVGHELLLNLNMSASDHAAMPGSIVVSVLRIPAGTAGSPESLPGESLLRALPNPMSSSATIRLPSPEDGPFRVRIYDTSGRLLRTLDGGPTTDRMDEITWDARDDRGIAVAPGTYYCQVSGRTGSWTRKLTVVR